METRRWENRWLPTSGLLIALSAVWLFPSERGYFYSSGFTENFTALAMSRATNLSVRRGFLFTSMRKRADGTVRYNVYNRLPIGAFVLIKLSILPFEGDSSAQLAAARALMLAFFCAAAALAYLALVRLTGSRAVALGATLLAFSSYHLLQYSAIVSSEKSVDLCAVMLVFHGMVLFQGGGRAGRRGFWQLAGKVCVALLLGWHVYGLLLPFLALGAAQVAVAAWREGAGWSASSTLRTFAKRLGRALVRVLRSRYALLGALALLFGGAVLGYNIAQEHAVFGGQRAVAELPSVRSMLRRTGLSEAGFSGAKELAWPTFLKWQFHRVGALCLPFALAGGIELDERAWRKTEAPLLFWTGVVATLGCFAGLALLRRPRAPPAVPAAAAALALAGFCWALLARGNTAWDYHQFEAMFHVGVPLCLFAAGLLALRRRWRQVAVFGAAASVVVFAGSSFALGLRHVDAGEAQAQREQMAEFDAIATMIRGRTVWVATHASALDKFVRTGSSIVDFLTAGSYVQYANTPAVADPTAIDDVDFVLAFERYDVPSLLTPRHRFVFLYQAGAGAAAVLEAMRDTRREEYRRLQALGSVARSGFNIHVVPGETRRRAAELVYLKAPCGPDDTKGRFFLRLVPVDANLSSRERLEFERRDHIFFNGHGVMVDDKCVMRVALPRWPVANVSTGQFHPAGDAASWRVAFRLDVDRLRDVLQAARREAPWARGEFDLYLRRETRRETRRGVLLYVREPCTREDVRHRFFLHVVPAAAAALAAARRRSGFANLDFDFGERGALLDGACVATVELPDYDIARLRTGQFDANARAVAWRMELAPNGPPGER